MAKTLDFDMIGATLRRFITGKLLESGLTGYVVGLSGGVDSAFAATLAVRAVGREKVFGLMLPFKTSSPDSLLHAQQLADQLEIETKTIDITPMLEAYFSTEPTADKIRIGNKAARERMSILFDFAQQRQAMVLGTSNRSEFCLGYTTWFGDSAASINPLAELYKTEVLELSRILGLPKEIMEKSPSADLWPGQTDEAELGVSYVTLDKLLGRMIDDGESSMATLQAEGFEMVDISRVVSLVNRHAYKRAMPAVAPLGRGAVPSRLQLQA